MLVDHDDDDDVDDENDQNTLNYLDFLVKSFDSKHTSKGLGENG